MLIVAPPVTGYLPALSVAGVPPMLIVITSPAWIVPAMVTVPRARISRLAALARRCQNRDCADRIHRDAPVVGTLTLDCAVPCHRHGVRSESAASGRLVDRSADLTDYRSARGAALRGHLLVDQYAIVAAIAMNNRSPAGSANRGKLKRALQELG